MAQRKREHTRLDGKIRALDELLGKVEESKRATTAMCSENGRHKNQIEKYIAEESETVRTTLKKMPTLSSELLFDLSTVLPAPPAFPSFLQLRGRAKQHAKVHDPATPILKDLAAMAKKFPEDSASLVDAQHRLMADRSPDADAQDARGKKP